MDFLRPVQAVIPGAQGRVLAVLADVSTDLTAPTIGQLSGVSKNQVIRILSPLVELGLVERRDVPPVALYRLVEDHVAAAAVLSLARVRTRVLDHLRRTGDTIMPAPISVVAFGSFARGEAERASDIDLLVVRAATVDPDDQPWAASLEAWRLSAERLTGNRVQLVEVEENEVTRLLRSGRSFWQNVLNEELLISGRRLRDFTATGDA